MGVALCRTIALEGTTGHVIDVQADVSPGTVGATVVGRPDVALNESRERCRMATLNSGLPWPTTRRTTILLSPADLAKRGTHFDLAIAVAVLWAGDQRGSLHPSALAGTVLIGELTLDGGLRCVPGVLPMSLAAAGRGVHRVLVPEPQAQEAAMVPGLEVYGVRSLAQAVAVLTGTEVPDAAPVAPMSATRLLTWRGEGRQEELDLADLRGMADARFALEVAAAGGHHLMLSGPKGSGKTSLAERLSGLLPPLSPAESLELTAIRSLAGVLDSEDGLITRPPFLAPHHDASATSLLGGGSGQVRPGAVSQAHLGVLFLDELPLFRVDAVDGLRQPLENGEVTIARRDETATFPARCQLVVASNPCPCGNYGSGQEFRCTCLDAQRRTYLRKLRGPVLDRIDITRDVVPVRPDEGRDPWSVPESTSVVAARVAAARQRQHDRFRGRSWRLNAHAPGSALARDWPLPEDGEMLLDAKVYDGELSRRGAIRVHRLAWTVADLAGSDRPGLEDVEVALALRVGAPVPARCVERAG